MTTHDIELPPLPKASKMYDIPGYDEEELKDYARAAIEADRKRRGELVLVGWAVSTTGKGMLPASRYTEFEARRAGYSLPVYRLAASQPAESCASLMSDKPACGSKNGDCDSQPAEPDSAKCAECGAELIPVRPGKWQHPDCSQSYWAAEPVGYFYPWELERSLKVYPNGFPGAVAVYAHPQPAEPVKTLIDNQEPLGEEFQRVFDEHSWDLYVKTNEPVKVPSDKDILTVWADTPKADSRSGDAIAFARAILAHYGQAAHQGGNNET